MSKKELPEIVTPKDLAAHVGCATQTVYNRLKKEGILPKDMLITPFRWPREKISVYIERFSSFSPTGQRVRRVYGKISDQ